MVPLNVPMGAESRNSVVADAAGAGAAEGTGASATLEEAVVAGFVFVVVVDPEGAAAEHAKIRVDEMPRKAGRYESVCMWQL